MISYTEGNDYVITSFIVAAHTAADLVSDWYYWLVVPQYSIAPSRIPDV